MKKIILMLIAVMFLCAALIMPAAAYDPALDRVIDEADILTDDQEAALSQRIEAMTKEHSADFVVVTVNSTGGKSHMAYADDFYDYGGYGFGDDWSGMLFLICMDPGDRGVWVSTTGECMYAFGGSHIDTLLDGHMMPALRSGKYYKALDKGLRATDRFLASGKMPAGTGTKLTVLAVAAVIGAIAGGITVGVMKRKMKTVRPAVGAGDYTVPGSFNLTARGDYYLYSNTIRTKKPESSSSSGGGGGFHSGSSGRSHGGGGRSF